MAQAKQGDTVKVNYTGKLTDGTVFDSSEGGPPLEFVIGGDQIIPDFEQAVIGMGAGESKTIQISAEKAYGPHDENMVIEVERQFIPEDVQIEAGMQMEMRQEDGMVIPVTVTNVTAESVTVDANHPLAGKDLSFDIELVEIG